VTDPSETRVVATAAELVGLVELEDVIFYNVTSARRDEPGPEQPSQVMQVFVQHDGPRLEVRVQVQVDTEDGRYLVDVSARFTTWETMVASDEVKQEFVERVGVMTVYPYIRETITTNAAKMRLVQPLMQLLRAGEAKLTPHPGGDRSGGDGP